MDNIDKNIVIATFMGWTPSKTNPDYLILRPSDDKIPFNSPLKIFDPKSDYFIDHPKRGCRPSSLMYHKSWDWLMPVVKKCNDLFISFDSSKKDQSNELDLIIYIDDVISVVDIEATHKAVVKFIEWYDENI